MIKNLFIFLLIATLISSCFNPPRPYIKSKFEYYQKDYEPEITYLKMYAPYYDLKDTSDGLYTYYYFFDNGLVKEFFSQHSTGETLRGTKKIHSADVFGYYRLKGDSIFFTTKVFYDKKQRFYSGKIKNDTITLSVFDNKKDYKKNKLARTIKLKFTSV